LPSETTTWVELALAFQTAIVGVVGFFGVISAQLLNAYLQRKRDETTTQNRNKAIIAIIRAELTIFKDAFLKPDPYVEMQKDDVIRLTKMHRRITSTLMVELGFFESTTLEKVLTMMATIDGVYDILSIVSSEDATTHMEFKGNKWRLAANSLNETGRSIEEILALLPSDAKKSRSANA
jgi:hypothetical protein